MRFPRALLTAAAAAALVSGSAGATSVAATSYFRYAGTTSQNEPFALVMIGTGHGAGYQLQASWHDRYTPAACNDTIIPPKGILRIAVVHVYNRRFTVTNVSALPASVLPHKVTLSAVFTPHKVTGSFTDVSGYKGHTGPTLACSTGPVTFTAAQL